MIGNSRREPELGRQPTRRCSDCYCSARRIVASPHSYSRANWSQQGRPFKVAQVRRGYDEDPDQGAGSPLLDRGWGKAVQPIAGDDGEPLTIVIRQILEPRDVDLTPTGTTTKLVN
jgi:hypothetical protein